MNRCPNSTHKQRPGGGLHTPQADRPQTRVVRRWPQAGQAQFGSADCICFQRQSTGDYLLMGAHSELNKKLLFIGAIYHQCVTYWINDPDRKVTFVNIFGAPFEFSDVVFQAHLRKYDTIATQRWRMAFITCKCSSDPIFHLLCKWVQCSILISTKVSSTLITSVENRDTLLTLVTTFGARTVARFATAVLNVTGPKYTYIAMVQPILVMLVLRLFQTSAVEVLPQFQRSPHTNPQSQTSPECCSKTTPFQFSLKISPNGANLPPPRRHPSHQPPQPRPRTLR